MISQRERLATWFDHPTSSKGKGHEIGPGIEGPKRQLPQHLYTYHTEYDTSLLLGEGLGRRKEEYFSLVHLLDPK